MFSWDMEDKDYPRHTTKFKAEELHHHLKSYFHEAYINYSEMGCSSFGGAVIEGKVTKVIDTEEFLNTPRGYMIKLGLAFTETFLRRDCLRSELAN